MPAISHGLGAPVASVVLVLMGAFGGLAATVAAGTSPQLGLDLQGGASVVLQPKTRVPASVLDQAIEIIRNRVDALGVAEPDISRQGSSIIVQLPGVRNRDRALDPQTVHTVSASLGRDSLRAGVMSGLVGLGLVALYMVVYYRAPGLVVWLGLRVTAAVMYSLVSLLGRTSGLALTLAGATGVIVSVGVTVDSYVVFFERLKDQVRAGKGVRSSVARGFSGAYRTILAADLASFLGAVVLYLLTGSVRGFAFFLALSTLLALVIAYFFTRPIVLLLAHSRLFTESRWLGVARGPAASPALVATDKGALS